MIQRTQSLWLFLASVAILALFLFPYLHFSDAAGVGKALKVTGIFHAVDGLEVREKFYFFQMIVTALIALFPLYIVFLFRNRKLQVRLIYVEIILVVLLGIWMYTNSGQVLAESRQFLSARNIGVGFFLLPLNIILLLMAISGIQRDERLIRSAERLR